MEASPRRMPQRHVRQTFTSFSRRPRKRASAPACSSQKLKRKKPSSSQTPVNNFRTQNHRWRPVAGVPAAASNISGIPLGCNRNSSSPRAVSNTPHWRRKRQRQTVLLSNKRSRVSASADPNSNFSSRQRSLFNSFNSFNPFDPPPSTQQRVSHRWAKRKFDSLALAQPTKRTRQKVEIDGRPDDEFTNSTCTEIVPAFPSSPDTLERTDWTFTEPLMQSEALSRQSVLTDRTSAPTHAQLVPAPHRHQFDLWLNNERKEPDEVVIELLDDDDCSGIAMDVEDEDDEQDLSIFNVD